jgi:hypothetical protein
MSVEDGFEPARRELCPDGTCIGLIGADGRCKVCGTVGPSAVADPRRQGMVAVGDGEVDDDVDDQDDRELCPDGTCVGLIGADGRCNVCGRARELAAAKEAWATDGGAAAPIEVEEDEERELCPDGSCIGLVGADGRCKVCGLARGSVPG